VADDLLTRYLAEIGTPALLSRREEEVLARKIEAGEEAARELGGAGALPPGREVELRRLRAEGALAREALIHANLRLVVSVARRYRWVGLPLLDLIQEGNVGLMTAVDKFDYRRGTKFSTHATWWIRQAIQSGIDRTGSLIHLPQRVRNTVLLVHRTAARLDVELGRHAEPAEVAAELSMAPADVLDALRLSRPVRSLHEPIDETGSLAVLDTVEDRTAPPPPDVVATRLLPVQLQRLMSVLTERERKVVALRFGFDRGEPRTRREVGALLDLTAERIRQIEGHALAKLQRATRATLSAALDD
jgi:RNA polymerase primary sigma factor